MAPASRGITRKLARAPALTSTAPPSDITARLELSSCRQGGREHGEGEGEAAKTADREGDVAPRAKVRLPIQAANGEDAAGTKYDQNGDQPQRRNAEQCDGCRDRTTIARYGTNQDQRETREHAQETAKNQLGGSKHDPPFPRAQEWDGREYLPRKMLVFARRGDEELLDASIPAEKLRRSRIRHPRIVATPEGVRGAVVHEEVDAVGYEIEDTYGSQELQVRTAIEEIDGRHADPIAARTMIPGAIRPNAPHVYAVDGFSLE